MAPKHSHDGGTAGHRWATPGRRNEFAWRGPCAARVLAFFCAAWLGTVAGTAGAEFHVSPDGRDTNPGTRSAPFGTLERARDAIRALRAEGRQREPVTVRVRDGAYHLPRTLLLDARDSGEKDAPVVYRSEAGQSILVGGRPISGFGVHEGPILKADVRSQGFEGVRFRLLVFNGRRQELARYPNRDPADINGGRWAFVDGRRYNMYADSPDEDGYLGKNKHLDYWQRNLPRLTRTLHVRPEDMRSWKRPEEAEVSIFPRFNWWHYVLPIQSFDVAGRVLHLKPGCFYEIRPGDRYFVRNVREELDAPGEWYLDDRSWMLFFWPPGPIDGKAVYAPILSTVLEMKGCRNVLIEGFTIECCEGTAVKLTDCTDCSIAGCSIRNTGGTDGHGVSIENGKGNRVFGNDIHDIGCHGVCVSGGDPVLLAPGRNNVENNYIHHVGMVGRLGRGIEFTGCGNRAAHNLIHDIPQGGIELWGNRHVVEFNHIRHTCLEGEDTGAICGGAIDYISWLGVAVRNNYIHDTIGFGYDWQAGKWRSPFFTFAVYPDWAASGVEITGNIFARAPAGLLHLHSGRDNLVENNVFVDGGQNQVECNGWTTATGYWSTKIGEWTAMYEKASRHPAWRDIRALKDPRLVPLPDGRVMYGNVIRRNIFYYGGETSTLVRFNNVPFDRNESDFNTVYHFGRPIRTGESVVKSERGENLLSNGGLEEGPVGGFPAGWGFPPGDGTRVSVADGGAHQGTRSLLVQPAPPAAEDKVPRMLYLTLGSVPFRPGRTYCLSVWMKSEGAPVLVDLGAFAWQQDIHSWNVQTAALLTDKWRRYELAFRLPAEGDEAYKPTMDTLHWRLVLATGSGRFRLDDACLCEADLSDEWVGWQARGMDRHSVVADPLFVDPARDDYRLKPESPALRLGFKPIPVDRIGPYADPRRASWPIVEEPGAREAMELIQKTTSAGQ